MVATTEQRIAARHTHNTSPTDRLRAYLAPIITAVFALGVTVVAFTIGGQIIALEAGLLVATAYFGFTNTRRQRAEAREWARLRAQYDKETTDVSVRSR